MNTGALMLVLSYLELFSPQYVLIHTGGIQTDVRLQTKERIDRPSSALQSFEPGVA